MLVTVVQSAVTPNTYLLSLILSLCSLSFYISATFIVSSPLLYNEVITLINANSLAHFL